MSDTADRSLPGSEEAVRERWSPCRIVPVEPEQLPEPKLVAFARLGRAGTFVANPRESRR